ncbi:MAG: hypothetical protein PHY74_07655 [Candidatus Bathyarchaeota archaeon]|nr:hypothetical protein [Candidatus Bathyarchaeota archaeon]MDD4325841.1 hypothetical protein [Candidatus Bathyarchaeota archaeon]MDI9578777.1 hypothetical protein [Thermoproteota archaeon]MDT8781082.1 hypothetical protein [Candidatus Bathyarchaeota archaeon]
MDYAKTTLNLLKDGPKRRQWLVNQLSPRIMSERKLDKTLKELVEEGKIVKHSKTSEEKGGWETWYMLPDHRYLLEVDAQKIDGAIERLKPLLLRMPTVEEIAVEAGITPTEAEQLSYRFATQTGWYKPTRKLIEQTKTILGEALVCAARIRDRHVDENGKSKDFIYEQDLEDDNILKEAKRFLKDYPSLLPELSKDGDEVVEWPSNTLRLLGENYSPIGRQRPNFFAINRGTGERTI